MPQTPELSFFTLVVAPSIAHKPQISRNKTLILTDQYGNKRDHCFCGGEP